MCLVIATLASQCTTESDESPTGNEAGDGAGGSRASGGSHATGGSSATGGGSGDGGSSATGGGSGAGGSSVTGGGGGEGGVPADGQGAGGETELVLLTVASRDGYLRPPPPECTTRFVDYGCDVELPLACDVPDEVISFDAGDGSHCPFCAAPRAGDSERSCSDVRQSYGDFLSDLVSASCANYCDGDEDCFGWEIVNACGNFVVSLYGAIDEEPLAFAEEFAATHCGVCGAISQSACMRRPGADRVEGGAPAGSFLEGFEPLCVDRHCVLSRIGNR